MRTELVVDLLRAESVARQVVLLALDECERVAHLGPNPEIALLGAEAAIALVDGLDLGKVDFVDEAAAVAVGAVPLKGLLCFVCHGRGRLDVD